MFFNISLLLSLLPVSLSTPNLLKTSIESPSLIHAATPLSEGAAPELLHSKDTFNPTQAAIDLHNNAPGPMKITCLTIGSRGDVQPYIALCQGLNDLGHTCSIATHSKFQNWISESGIGFRPVAGDPEELIKHCTQHGLSPSFWWNGKKKFGTWFDDLLKSSWEACKDSDLLIESPSAMVGAHIAQALEIPYIRAFTMPWTKTGAYPHAMAAMGQYWGGWMNKLSYKLFDRITWLLIRDKINDWRETQLLLQRTTLAELKLSQVPFLYNFSPSVVPKPSDWGHLVHITGYWFVKQKQNEARLPENLQRAIDNAKAQGKKIVYIGFGSIIVPEPQRMTDAVVGAVEEANVFAVISGGWTAGAAEGTKKVATKASTETAGATDGATKAATEAPEPVPEQAAKDADAATAYMKRKIGERPHSMYYVDSVSHDALFPQLDAALHHGGAGTTAASIRAGIPTLIKPFFGDQTLWAQRVEKLGVGIHVKSLKKEHVLDALIKATTDEKKIRAARELGKQVDSEQGVETAIRLIYELMGSSKHLIQETRKINKAKKISSVRRLGKLRQIKAQLTQFLADFPFNRFWRLVINLRKGRLTSGPLSKSPSGVKTIKVKRRSPNAPTRARARKSPEKNAA